MPRWAPLTITTMLCCAILLPRSWAQEESRHRDQPSSAQSNSGRSAAMLQDDRADRDQDTDPALTHPLNKDDVLTHDGLTHDGLTNDDRLSLIAAALDSRVRKHSEPDCSHLVHAIYQQAGFPYAYAPSSDIYTGVEGFRRVKHPQPGDLVVWRGHVGMVIKPSEHIFFSFMRSGPGTDDYETPYWKGRGHPRFYRYVKNSFCADCDPGGHRSRRLVKVKR